MTDDLNEIIKVLDNQLQSYLPGNKEKVAYYTGSQLVRHMGISIPPEAIRITTDIGWAGIVVDVLEERLNLLGWNGKNTYNLESVFAFNEMDILSSQAHIDALIYGTSFVVVGPPDKPGGIPLISVESPERMTCIRDSRTKKIEYALLKADKSNITLFTPEITYALVKEAGYWRIVETYNNPGSIVPVVQLVNRPRATDINGRSEITRSIRSAVDAAARTFMRMEVAQEFFSAPQRYALGVAMKDFVDGNGNPISAWSTLTGRIWGLEKDDDGDTPNVGQFDPITPGPHLEQLLGMLKIVAGEAGIPPSFLGMVTENPPSADSAQIHEARLVRRANRRMSAFGWRWLDVARLILLQRDGKIPEDFSQLSTRWGSPVTSTPAATADEIIKLISAGILPPDSQVTLDRAKFTPAEQETLKKEIGKLKTLNLIDSLSPAADKASEDEKVAVLSSANRPVEETKNE